MNSIEIQPSLEKFLELVEANRQLESPPNLYPIFNLVINDKLTPHTAYLRVSNPDNELNKGQKNLSFLLESARNGDQVDRFSFVGCKPFKSFRSGPMKESEIENEQVFGEIDPINELKSHLDNYKQAEYPGIPRLSGGALGYVSYDCIKYFEPKTKRDLKDVLELPESYLMFFKLVVAMDHYYQRIQVINNIEVGPNDTESELRAKYLQTKAEIEAMTKILFYGEEMALEQGEIKENVDFKSNIGQAGYEAHVAKLKEHIKLGDIIQAVPSQRISRPTGLHPFNIYRHLRMVNPSPYLFYLDYLTFQIIGASPELLVKSNSQNKVITHPIAGTIRRGKTKEEDDELADELRNSLKDRAEHIMLVDLARNDINRVCDPVTVNVDRLLTIERFSHVMHLVSEVSGTLRPEKDRFDAFKSIFPAGTVSGAPKVRAMELISEIEKEKRGVYAGAVGHWGFDGKTMDTCIALRTMVYKDGVAYLQAGGGIVYDSDPYEEYIETINKMKANNSTIVDAEKSWTTSKTKNDS